MNTPPDFEPDFVAQLTEIFENSIRFNHLLGIRVTRLRAEQVGCELEMRGDLIGHFTQPRLHGGVISAVLDAMGGLAVMAAIGDRHRDEPIARRLARFVKLGTIDLRVDYLRAATGPRFSASATTMRLGSRVASTRMEFSDAQGKLLSTASAAYIVS